MYSTAEVGGTGPCQCGTVFRFNPAPPIPAMVWNYSFRGFPGTPPDGAFPTAGLVWDSAYGRLLGTTGLGGNSSNCASGCGTVFKIGLGGGGEAPVFSFTNTTTGNSPVAGLDRFGGTLYGTSYAGIGSGSGTVFSIP